MSDRALLIAACVLAVGLVAVDADNEDQSRIVISRPTVSHTDWDHSDLSGELDDLDDQDTDLEELDVDEDSGSVYFDKAKARQLADRERMRLRAQMQGMRECIREQAGQIRVEARSGFRELRGAGRQVGDEFRSFGRQAREEGRMIRQEMRALRQHLQVMRQQVRESVREAVRNKESRRIHIELD